jgi:beta-phosphoglucomutase-like phosphatase (HAD superfamily)/thiamine kinase-like enzyme
MVFYTKNTDSNPIYSYIEVDADSTIINIKEKQKISDNANTGAYAFTDIVTLYYYCNYILDNNILANNEPYTSCVISEMLKNNIVFKSYEFEPDSVVSLGTPTDVEKYMKETKLLLFDLDGTLVNTDNIYISVWNELLSEFNVKCNIDFFNHFIKGKNDDTFLKYLNSNISEKDIKKMSAKKDDLFILHLSSLSDKSDTDFASFMRNGVFDGSGSILIDGALRFFEKNKNHKIAIVTSSNRSACNHILRTCGLNKYVDFVIASEDCKNHKPHPEPYLNAIKHFNICRENTFIFEDSYSGFCSAKRTGITNICLVVNEHSCPEIKNANEFKMRNYDGLTVDSIVKFYSTTSNNDNDYLTEIQTNVNTLPIKKITQNDKCIKTGYICDIISYDVEYINGETENIILKISNLDNELSSTALKLEMYKNESYFYSNMSKYIKNTPTYMGHFNYNGKEAIILENLHKYNGSFNIDLNTNIHILLNVVNSIFDIHCKFYFSSEEDIVSVVKPLKKVNEIAYYKELIMNRFDKFTRNTFDLLSMKERQILLNIFANIDNIYESVSQFPLSVCHGDLKSPNIFYKYNCNPILLDWQYIHLNKGVSDIAFLLVESVEFDQLTVDIIVKYYYKLHKEKYDISYEEYMNDFRNALCVFPFFVCVWFNSENKDTLLDPVFPIRFLRNLINYYNYFMDE